ncbi:MAG: ketoacyl-ACP synthase III [Deltaproteobacteria bacterium]|nr:ketoacyl-ACP synthase III [Deltaproteobacteria bacterium]MBM4316166.1 ketoacyl-ACP synthase III [Deltaproteobacteria bacterium]
MSYFSKIIGTGKGLPAKAMTNKDFEAFVETSDEWIRTRTGISQRHIIDSEKGESTLSLSRLASLNALEKAGIPAQDIELIIVGTITPESVMPTTANSLQRDLGAVNAFSFDLQAACSGFLYGLSIADQYIRSGTIKTALVVGAETLSTLIDWQDRSTCVLFGDAAGAAILTRTKDKSHAILSTRTYSDGTRGDLLKIPHGYGACPPWRADYRPSEHKIKMQGSEIFKLAVRNMCDASLKVLEDNQMKVEDVDFFIFHQANIRIIEMCAKTLNVPLNKSWLNVDKYGNTSAATLPICLDEAWRAGAIKSGDKVLMTTFGGGITWGATLFQV